MLSSYVLKKLVIGNRTINNSMVLAPMAGLGHIALRQLISGFGGFGLLFTGMCSAKAVPFENPEISPVFRWRQKELDYLVCQIFGSDPDTMAEAAIRIEKEGFFGVDLNFGCSVAAICKKGAGAALLRNPQLCFKIVKTVRDNVSIPLFVKFRTGWKNDPEFAAYMAKGFEDAGADALTFHPRVAPDRRSRPPHWGQIGLVQDAVSIPVFGNGNIFSAEHGLRMLSQTGCKGLSIGRMAVARPWIFAQWTRGFTPDNDIFFTTALEMTRILSCHYDDHYAVKLFRKFAVYFCANFKFGHQMQKKLFKPETIKDLCHTLESIFEKRPETLSGPNQNLFV